MDDYRSGKLGKLTLESPEDISMKQEAPIDLWAYERKAFDAGIKLVCGVDEAGRGPLAGPVCAAAVMLPPGLEIPGLNDSKKAHGQKSAGSCTMS